MIVDAVIVAAGSSTRFGEDKLGALLCERPVLDWSIAAFASSPNIGQIVVVTTPDRTSWAEGLCAGYAEGRELHVVEGGARRRDSVAAGLRVCRTRYVAIHDGARPLVTTAVIEAVIRAADGHGGAIAAVPVTDTIKTISGALIGEHLDRRLLRAAQTPQVVLRRAWLDAAAASDDDETDDAAMLARLGLACAIADGDPSNIKITMPWDIATAEAILRARKGRE